jgi:molybdenum cofactor synthesis domain-containing protein
MHITVGLITISDRAARGIYPDRGGPALKEAALGYGWQVVSEKIVPDDRSNIQHAVQEQIDAGCQLILTTGGTGVSPRDVTPEAVREIAARELPGFGEVMRLESRKITPHAILSRNLAVVVQQTLVVCLPGKPGAATECLGFVAPAIPHAIEIIRGVPVDG